MTTSLISLPVSDWECHNRGSASYLSDLIKGRAFLNSFPYRVWELEGERSEKGLTSYLIPYQIKFYTSTDKYLYYPPFHLTTQH